MRPRTKLHFEVLKLAERLSEPKEHEQYVISKHDHYYTKHYKNFVCLECNHMWKPDLQIWAEQVVGVKCPSCGRKLKHLNKYGSGLPDRIIIYSDAQVVERFQVIRYYSCWKSMSKNQPPRYTFRSLFEEWKDWDKDKRVVIGRTTSGFGDGFSCSTYEIRNIRINRWSSSEYDHTVSDVNCPGPEFIPRFKKYGLEKHYDHCCDYRKLLYKIELSPKIETLFKLKQRHLLYNAVVYDGPCSRYWPQIKIAIRHKYKIKDPGIWYDYLDLLVYFKKDIHNPKFICPRNLMKEHDRWMKKKERVLEQQRIERERQEVIKRQQDLGQSRKDYVKRFRKYFKLKFTSGDISIQALQSVDEFQDEGKELNHCIFTNEYYNKEDSLLLSARVLGVRTETVEVCLKTFKILQSRGKNNNATDYNDVIRDIVERNMRKISKIANSSKKNKNKVKP